MPTLAEGLALLVAQYAAQRNIALRLFEPIKAPEQTTTPAPARKAGPQRVMRASAVAIDMEGVDVVAAGHTILQNVTLNIRPGEHVAVVGPSGAGKSSLLGLLLGWHQAAAGGVLIDGEVLGGARLLQLRGETAWG